MIPTFAARTLTIIGLLAEAASFAATPPAATPGASAKSAGAPVEGTAVACLASGDGYLRAKLAGAVDAQIDWPNSGTRCEGEFREKPPGVRLSFQRDPKGAPDLLLVFGLTGVK